MTEVLAEGRYLRLKKFGNGWEFVERTRADGVVVIVATTDADKVIFVEQFRPPVGATVIEFPAGLAGDSAEFAGEGLEIAAERELLEEAGYAAEQMRFLTSGPPSAGLSSESVTFFRATGLRRVAEGGGDESEEIDIHEVSLQDVPQFLQRAQERGALIDPKVYTGLYFLGAVQASARPPSITLELPDAARRLDSPKGLAVEDELFKTLDALLPPLPDSGRVGILGGSFNPPHVGHALLAQAMLATEGIDALWIVPVFQHPFGKDSAGFEDRVQMCRLAFQRLSDVSVIEIERELPKPSYTVQTLSALHAVRPGISPTLVIGSDIVPELPRWQSPEQLPVLSRIVVVPRQGAPLLESAEIEVKVHRGFRLPKVSSTAIKKALRSGHPTDGLLDTVVYDFIKSRNLYR